MNSALRLSSRILSLGAIAALVGCGAMSEVTPGTPLQQVISQYGKPAVTCRNADGTERVVWTQEPAGEQAWAAEVDANGNVSAFTQVLAASEFEVLNEGSWDAKKVNCYFGPPSKIKTYPDEPNQTVWLYQYTGSGTGGYMMLYVTIDKATNRVVGYSTGPNPELNPLIMGP